MAREKSDRPRKDAHAEGAPQITPMPFPGESPTVSLAMAAARMYGLPPEDEKPARSKSKRRASATKKPARVARQARKTGAKARKPARAGKTKAASKAKRVAGGR